MIILKLNNRTLESKKSISQLSQALIDCIKSYSFKLSSNLEFSLSLHVYLLIKSLFCSQQIIQKLDILKISIHLVKTAINSISKNNQKHPERIYGLLMLLKDILMLISSKTKKLNVNLWNQQMKRLLEIEADLDGKFPV